MSVLLPIFLMLVVGVVEVASALNTHITVVNAARDGARLGSKGGATEQQIKDLVVAETQRLHPAVDGTSDVTVQNVTVNGTSAVRVEVCATHSLILGVRVVMPDSYRMCSNTVMRVAQGGS
jgi:Flp pilus assembly protein TadG